MTKNKHKYPAVYIKWNDSSSLHGWREGPVKHLEMTCESVAWLILDGKDAVTVSAHHGLAPDEPEFHGIMTIPRAAIVHMKRLRMD